MRVLNFGDVVVTVAVENSRGNDQDRRIDEKGQVERNRRVDVIPTNGFADVLAFTADLARLHKGGMQI